MTEQDDMTINSMIKGEQLQQILEAALLAAGQPLTPAQLSTLFNDEERPPTGEISRALEQLRNDCAGRGVELTKVSSGFRMQVRQELNGWVSRLWKERPPRYSRALLETIALIAYRQPITRGEIESVRGVSVSTNIIRTLQEREWIRVVGHRDVPGKPALFGTTHAFLDSFGLQNLDDLPTLAEIRDMENIEPELQLEVSDQSGDADDMTGDKADDPDRDPVEEPDDETGVPDNNTTEEPDNETGDPGNHATEEPDDETGDPGNHATEGPDDEAGEAEQDAVPQ